MSGSMKSKMPLVTFALFAYNQEKFIREAVEGAFAQDYEHLEIILSDDSSTDNTYLVMTEMVNEYRGKHRVILNRNDRNLGLARHINKIMKTSSGSIFIVAAGDDVSLPNRTLTLVNKFIEDPELMSVSSKAECIDDNSVKTREFMTLDNNSTIKDKFFALNHCVGCSHAWKKKLFDIFGPLNSFVINEDVVISSRAALLNKISYIDNVLVMYRRHNNNTDKRKLMRRIFDANNLRLICRAKTAKYELAMDIQRFVDFQTASDLGILEIDEVMVEKCLRDRLLNSVIRDKILQEKGFFRTLWNFLKCIKFENMRLVLLKISSFVRL